MTTAIRLATFNCENLFARYKFNPVPGGGKKTKSTPELEPNWGYLPPDTWKNSFELFGDRRWRTLTASALLGEGEHEPDICCLQEIENMAALRKFNAEYLDRAYPYALLIDGHDMRLIDVAVLSKYPILEVRSHIDEVVPDGGWLFSRDCLEVTFDVRGTPLTVMVNHLKSQLSSSEEETKRANARRKMQAARVVAIAEQRFGKGKLNDQNVCIVGDFNDTPDSPWVAPLMQLGFENMVERLPADERWTHLWAEKNIVGQLDYVLLPQRLAGTSHNHPFVERRGLVKKRSMKVFFEGAAKGTKGVPAALPVARFAGVDNKVSASDHCPVVVDFSVI